jgi:phenylpropionate dioxygenase-like ring-hydroxylating dioxygenase large terminal subunit
MIRNQWYVIMEGKEVKKKPVGVTRMGEKMVLWRSKDDQVHCMADRCPHMNAPLHKGKIVDNHIQCPFHGFEYDSSGQCVHIPALGIHGSVPKVLKARHYWTHEAHGLIWIYWGEAAEKPTPPPFFDSIDASFSFTTFRDHWNVHYSRMAENQLDVSHLPFVHHNTIGRGGRKVVDGPLVRLENNRSDLWVYNRVDDGTTPRKANELPEPTREPFLQFQFPNLWQNWIAPDMRITIAFVPVDEENTIMYGRYYQRVMKVPILKQIFNFSGRIGSRIIACQDKRVVTQQIPKKTSYNMGERLRPSDGAVIAYRRHRRELKIQASQDE